MLLPVKQAANGVPDSPSFTLRTDAVRHVDVATKIVARDHSVVAPETFHGTSVLAPAEVDAITRAAPPSGFRILGSGDTLAFPASEAVSLAPGVYVEHVELTLLLADSTLPSYETHLRYFRVSPTGAVAPISSTEYSAELQTHQLGPAGRRMLAGSAGPAPADPVPVIQTVELKL